MEYLGMSYHWSWKACAMKEGAKLNLSTFLVTMLFLLNTEDLKGKSLKNSVIACRNFLNLLSPYNIWI
jgi:hypothetical protein